jgi:flagellar basal body-associated protein FliL
MKKVLIPAAMAVVGLVGGAAAGWMLKPPPPPPEPCLDTHGVEQPPEACAPPAKAQEATGDGYAEDGDPANASEFIPLDRQFIVPVVSADKVSSLVVVTLSVEVAPGHVEDVMAREPKVRDALLRTLFEHAYTGGFQGDFTAAHVMRELRKNLVAAVRKIAGPDVRDVLVTDIMRQDQ